MPDAAFPPQISPDDIQPVLAYLTCDNEMLRCAAVRATAGLVEDHRAQTEPALIEALMDPDPDVRADAMEGLAQIAPPDAGEIFLRSLAGDPVREVKLAAIEGLARIGARDAVPILRSLTLSRSETQVAWEDEDSDWEDWLDIQIAAIGALGRLGAGEAIGDLLTAWSDEMGQSLDVVVFDALGAMGAPGLAALMELITGGSGLSRRRAVAALLKLSPEQLRDQQDALLACADAQLRRAGLRILAPGNPQVAHFALFDPDASVRIEALRIQPDLADRALTDDDPKVQAEALSLLRAPLEDTVARALPDNLLAWAQTAPPVLMKEAARALPLWAGARAEPALLALMDDTDRPLEARVEAVRALENTTPQTPTATLVACLSNPAQQVRTAVLALLARRADDADEAAIDAIARAMSSTLLEAADAVIHRDEPADLRDAATPKGEGAGPRQVRITPEGDIVEDTDPQDNGGSTLAAILGDEAVLLPPAQTDAPDQPAKDMPEGKAVIEAEETPEESQGKRRKRRPVEGPDDIAEALSREAMQTGAGVRAAPIMAALLAQTITPDETRRRLAWTGLARHFDRQETDEAAVDAARAACTDDDPVVRHAAYSLLLRAEADPAVIDAAAREEDALIRVLAVPFLSVERAIEALGDPALKVRNSALTRVLEAGTPADVNTAVARALAAERSDTLGALVARSTQARAQTLVCLAGSDLPQRAALILLEGLAARRGSAAVACL